jgi:uncharacterized protein YdaU (DUF1376 family)
MMDYCYLNECGLPEDIERIARVIRMPEHCNSIAIVLLEFWTKQADGTYKQQRIESNLIEMRDRSQAAREKANKRWNKADAVALPQLCQSNATNTNTNTNTNIKHLSLGSDETVKIDYQAVIDIYNSTCKTLPAVKLITDKRKTAIGGCVSLKPSYSSLDFWQAYFDDVMKSDFLTGRKTDWKADFDFLTTKSRFVRVLEGSYE